MDESAWLSCVHPGEMLEQLRGRGSERKWRLFACACCRRVRHLLGNASFSRLLDSLERQAEWQGQDESPLLLKAGHAFCAASPGSGNFEAQEAVLAVAPRVFTLIGVDWNPAGSSIDEKLEHYR